MMENRLLTANNTRLEHIPGDGRPLSEIRPDGVLESLDSRGAVVLRGFEVNQPMYEAFSRVLCDSFHRVAARDALRDMQGDGFTAMAPSRNFTLLVHSEGTYQPFKAPDFGFFLCIQPPDSPGGESLLVDGRIFLAALPDTLRSRFESQGVIYHAYWEPARWHAEFGVDNQKSFFELQKNHPQLDCSFDGENMIYACKRSAVQPDRLGEPAFANAILAHLNKVTHPDYANAQPYSVSTNGVSFGDGEPLGEKVINALIDIQDSIGHEHRLRVNDFVVFDNTRVMHGRRPTEHDCERILLTRFGHSRGTLS